MLLTQVVGTDFESLITPHDNSDQLCLLVLQQPQIPGTSLLPLVGIGNESEQLGSHLEDDILVFLVGADVDLFSQLDDGLVVRIVVFFLLREFCVSVGSKVIMTNTTPMPSDAMLRKHARQHKRSSDRVCIPEAEQIHHPP